MEWFNKSFEELSSLELYKILQVRQEVFVLEQTCIYRDCDDKDQFAKHLFAMKNDKCVAYARLIPPDYSYPGSSSIGRVLVHPEFRKLDYGKLLMEQAIQSLVEDYPDFPIRISGQQYLEKFYNELGFKTESDMYLEDDIPHLEMAYYQHIQA